MNHVLAMLRYYGQSAVGNPAWAFAVLASLWVSWAIFEPPGRYPSMPAMWPLGFALLAVGVGFGFGLRIVGRTWRALVLAALVLAVWAGLLIYLHQLFAHPRWPQMGVYQSLIAVAIGGLMLGLLIGFLLRSRRSRQALNWPAQGRVLTVLALLGGLLVVFAPLSTAGVWGEGSWGFGDPVERVYRLIRGAIPWVPLGFVFAAGGLAWVVRIWVPAALLSFLIIMLLLRSDLLLTESLTLLYLLVGVGAGLWLGARAGEGLLAQASSAVQAPVSMVDSVARSRQAVGDARSLRDRLVPLQFPARLRAQPLQWLLAGLLLLCVVWLWWDFPRFQALLAAALSGYFVLLLRKPQAWLLVLPATLPVLDLAPWSGRFFLDESDLFLLTTLAAAVLQGVHPKAQPLFGRRLLLLAGLFVATSAIALVVGLWPLSPLDANAFSHYFSHFNALRVGKGFAWGLVLILMIRWSLPGGEQRPVHLFMVGVLLGLAGVIAVGLLERMHYTGLFDFSQTYRITASFSSMHTGGSHLPGFLALAVPFLWLWFLRLERAAWLPVCLILMGLSVYLVIATGTRASLLALAIELGLLLLLWSRRLSLKGYRLAAFVPPLLAAVLVLGGLLAMLGQGSFMQQRLGKAGGDLDTRLSHWQGALDMMDEGPATALFGMGLGSFPETYMLHAPLDRLPGNFAYPAEAGNTYLRLGDGETLYLGQRVDTQAGTRYALSFDLRGRGAAQVELIMPLCEKHLLSSRQCVWRKYRVAGDGDWHRVDAVLDSGNIGRGLWLSHPPVELYLYNAEAGQLLEVDNLSLRDPAGRELLRNGDFSAAGDNWFFRTDDHLAWHVKNLWVSMLFEQGWLGLLAFNLLLLAVLYRLLRRAWRGDSTAAVALSSLLGFLVLGLFASPFDAPRLSSLFLAVLGIGLYASSGGVTRSTK